MASLKDFPQVVRQVGFINLARKVWAEVQKDLIFTWASALAYAWIFAIVPFLVFLLSMAPYLSWSTKEKAIQAVSNVVYNRMGGEAGYMIVSGLENIMNEQRGGLLSIGLVLALWGASGGTAMTMGALDKAYSVEQER